jgi:serine/threonine protein kinase
MRACPSCLSVYSTDAEFCGLDGERLVAPTGDPLAGRVVGRYRLEALIGTGASGLVYRSTVLASGASVAIKILYGEAACDRRVLQRFRREADTASQLDHPNIVRVFDHDVSSSGLAYIVMELLSGVPLDVAITDEAPFIPVRSARIAQQIASGLAEAHRLGFVHRDLKPGNVMLVEEDGAEVAKILDFGIVGHMRPERGESRLTKVGFVVGTPAYMAPEQIDESVELGPAADLYSLGVILYEMLTGRSPFSGTVEQILVKKLTRDIEALPQHKAIGRLTVQLLARDPRLRPPSALHVSAEIHRLSLITPDAKTVLSAPPWANDVLGAPTVPARIPTGLPSGRAGVHAALPVDDLTLEPTASGPVRLERSIDTTGVTAISTDPSFTRTESDELAEPSLDTSVGDEDLATRRALGRLGSSALVHRGVADQTGEAPLVVPVYSVAGVMPRDPRAESRLGSVVPVEHASFPDPTDPAAPYPNTLRETLVVPEGLEEPAPMYDTLADALVRPVDLVDPLDDERTGPSTSSDLTPTSLEPFTATALTNLREEALKIPAATTELEAIEDTALTSRPESTSPRADELRTRRTATTPSRARPWTRHHLTYAAVGLFGFGVGLFTVLMVLTAREQTAPIDPVPRARTATVAADHPLGADRRVAPRAVSTATRAEGHRKGP